MFPYSILFYSILFFSILFYIALRQLMLTFLVAPNNWQNSILFYSILFYSRYDFEVRWEPFLLRPQIPKEGVPTPPITKDSQLYVFHATVNVMGSSKAEFSSKIKSNEFYRYIHWISHCTWLIWLALTQNSTLLKLSRPYSKCHWKIICNFRK